MLPPQTNLCQKSKRQSCWYGAKILAALRRVKPDVYGAPWCFQTIKSYRSGCRGGGVFSFFLCPICLNFFVHLFGSTVALMGSICPHARPLRACAKPQAGVSPPRRSLLVLINSIVSHVHFCDALNNWHNSCPDPIPIGVIVRISIFAVFWLEWTFFNLFIMRKKNKILRSAQIEMTSEQLGYIAIFKGHHKNVTHWPKQWQLANLWLFGQKENSKCIY